MDGGFWDVDMSTPVTINGLARPVPGHPTIPLGLSRGSRLSRPKQVDFFQKFMYMPFVPSFTGAGGGSSGSGLFLQRVFSFPFGENWFATLLGQFNVQKFVTAVKDDQLNQSNESSLLDAMGKHLHDKSLYALDLCSEMLLTPDDTLQVSVEANAQDKVPRKKTVLHHKFARHNLTLEAASPGLFVDPNGTYWDVPLTMALDLASVPSDAGASYHICVNQNVGDPKIFEGQPNSKVAANILPGLHAKSAFSYKTNIDLWRSKAPKMKLVQPYDAFLSNPHISVSGILGAVVSASLGENLAEAGVKKGFSDFNHFNLHARGANSSISADTFASVSLSAQHGNFQRLFLDLTRFYARMDFPSGSKFISGASHLANDLHSSQTPNMDAVQAIFPSATLSFQQQIAGPISFRVDSGVSIDLKNKEWPVSVKDPVFAAEYALQVLGSAKATAWYSPKQKEFMIELRFFEK